MEVHICNGCKHHHSEPSADYCFHKDNYCSKVDEYMKTTDAGYDCPLNCEQDDYVPIDPNEEVESEDYPDSLEFDPSDSLVSDPDDIIL